MSICFSKEFLQENMMGPNAVTMCEELTKDLPLSGCRRILDLGCGKGLSSLFLAVRLDAEVFAVDLCGHRPAKTSQGLSRWALATGLFPCTQAPKRFPLPTGISMPSAA